MKACVRVSVLALLALFALCGIPGERFEAQSTFASVRGSTVDQTGAAIPGAQVTLRSLDENTEAATTSDSEGNFVFENLKPGRYALTAAKRGFSKATFDQLELNQITLLTPGLTRSPTPMRTLSGKTGRSRSLMACSATISTQVTRSISTRSCSIRIPMHLWWAM